MSFQKKEIQKFENLELLARQVVEGFITGKHKSPYHGFSVEFAEHRMYNKGESTRHIDWKLFARTDKMYVKRFEEETNLRCQLVLDVSGSMFFPTSATKKIDNNSKLSFSVYAAAALINLFKRQRDAFGMSLLSDSIKLHTPVKSTVQHQMYLYNSLNALLDQKEPEKQSNSNLVNTIHEIAERIHKRSLVIIFSDMLDNTSHSIDEVFSALQHLKYNKHEIILFHVADKKTEIDFEFENRPYNFIDIETGDEIKLNPTQVQDYVANKQKDRFNQLKLKCHQYHIDLIEVDIAEPFDQVLLPYLVKRQKLY